LKERRIGKGIEGRIIGKGIEERRIGKNTEVKMSKGVQVFGLRRPAQNYASNCAS